jgi:hypothetical protein
MPPNTQTGPTPEQALASLLSSEQLTELVILISSITEGMAKRIADAFDATTDSNTIRHRERLQEEARNPNVGNQTDSGHEETEAEARARILRERRERDLPEPKLQDLKNDAVVYFQTWKDSLILTIVDALNAKDMQGIQTAEVTGSRHDTPPPDYNVLGMPEPQNSTPRLYFKPFYKRMSFANITRSSHQHNPLGRLPPRPLPSRHNRTGLSPARKAHNPSIHSPAHPPLPRPLPLLLTHPPPPPNLLLPPPPPPAPRARNHSRQRPPRSIRPHVRRRRSSQTQC